MLSNTMGVTWNKFVSHQRFVATKMGTNPPEEPVYSIPDAFFSSELLAKKIAFFSHAGMSQVFVMHPFDIIKVRLQTQPKDNKLYFGIVDCLTKIIKNEGPFALYKGTTASMQALSRPSSGSWDRCASGCSKTSKMKWRAGRASPLCSSA
jgi:hypothetical protein